MTLKIQYYTQFKRDIKRAKKRRLDMALLKEVVNHSMQNIEIMH
mgnify:CR=1 FL=1